MDGSNVLRLLMIDVAERMSPVCFDNAPVGTAIDPSELRTSGHPLPEQVVFQLYDEPPLSPRRPEGMPPRDIPVTYPHLKVQLMERWFTPDGYNCTTSRAIRVIANGGRPLDMDGVIDP